ncbi:hypothetical protein F2Q68_00020524 [Brassica cretica]|uniref:Uncharacterized protein n=1 Tax=Brassica cretica TaxID=69181 RepID=A0A8S9G5H8_BRACR|nr:hypothetical protein F2Q68_00020524 [Brassica cretica]
MAAEGSMQKGEEQWRAVLSPEQFRILRLKGTELYLCYYTAACTFQRKFLL